MSGILEQFFDVQVSSYEENKKIFVDHMDMLKRMSNEEHTLYKKWKEVQDFRRFIEKSSILKAQIWTPRDIMDKDKTVEDLEALQPEIIFVPPTETKMLEDWLILRLFIHTMEFEQNPGRFLRFLIKDKGTGKYLGVSSVGSDVISISCRDKYIGWNDENKLKEGRIRHSAIATTIVATQPFGYNFLGGKLVASMMAMDPVREAWKSTYDEELVGLTTTSLFGKHSMYQRIPYWKELGETSGKIMLKPDDEVYEIWHHWLKANKTDEYNEKTIGTTGKPATGVKQKIVVMIMQELGVKQSQYVHGFKRGVYYSPFYENTPEFLRNEIDESQLIPSKKLQDGVDGVMKWWKPKAIRRYEKLLQEDRIKDEILYYNDIIDVSWEETKQRYLNQVGR
jgi:hypothetical protein